MRILLILAVLMMVGCSGVQKAEKTIVQAENVEKSARANKLVMEESKPETSHICKAKTKKGGRCARRVSNEHGLTTYCFMHRGDSPAE